MYPVFSTLRSLAAHFVYAADGMLVERDGAFHLRLDKPSSYLDLACAKWKGPVDTVPMSCLVVASATSVGAAVSLSHHENKVAEACRASSIVYTLVAGPEVEEPVEQGVQRISRFAVVLGVYRTSSRVVLTQQPPPASQGASYRPPPKGTVRF